MAKLEKVADETLHHLGGGKVLWADYKFFSSVFGVSSSSLTELDEAIIEHFCWMSKPHSFDNEVHLGVDLSGHTINAIRPENYGRAAIINVRGFLYDLKGIGVGSDLYPSLQPYSSGLLPETVAINELYTQRLFSRVFASEHRISTVPCLGIIELPISAADRPGSKIKLPQAILIRPYRPREQIAGSDEQKTYQNWIRFSVEMRLRNFGITSCAPRNIIKAHKSSTDVELITASSKKYYPKKFLEGVASFCQRERITTPCRFDIINIQLCHHEDNFEECSIIDFEHFRYQPRFFNHVALLSGNIDQNYFEAILNDADDFVNKPSFFHDEMKLISIKEYKKIKSKKGITKNIRSKIIFAILLQQTLNQEKFENRRCTIADLISIADGETPLKPNSLQAEWALRSILR